MFPQPRAPGGCITCCGVSNFGITPNPIVCPIGDSMALGSTAVDCNGYSVYPSYTSSNGAVMTVDAGNNAHGVSVGQATIYANYSYQQNYTGQLCGISSCPTSWQQASAPATVQVPGSLTASIDLETIWNGNNMIECDGTNDGPRWGYSHCVL